MIGFLLQKHCSGCGLEGRLLSKDGGRQTLSGGVVVGVVEGGWIQISFGGRVV